MRYGVITAAMRATTGRWDARYNLAVAELLQPAGLPQTSDNVRWGMRTLAEHNKRRAAEAAELHKQAAELNAKARAITAENVT